MNKEVKKVIMTTALAATLSLSLSGCNKAIIDARYMFNKAIIINGDTATIIEIRSWNDYEGEQFQLITEDGLVIVTSAYDTKLINDTNSTLKAEDLARSIVGENGQINHLNKEKTLILDNK